MNRKGSKQVEAISVILGIIAVLLIVAALIITAMHYLPHKEDFSEYKNKTESVAELPQNPIDFDTLKAQNEDVCGWIKFDSTDIAVDYPIVRAGENKAEDYYLRRDIDGKYATAGMVYIQKVNSIDFSDPCTIIYGHNMRNLSMFGTLKYLRDKEIFDRNEFFYVYYPGHILKYAIKSAFVYDDRHVYYSFDFNTEDGFNAFAEEASNPQALVKNVRDSVIIKPDSKLAVLSTCTNGAENERYLVVAVLVEDTKTK
ncbi:MAG: class B sortase [Clostridia bacterium]|nr:class B sortase [Clostridia bacterium]